MKTPRPRSLNGLILVGFGLVAVPLLAAIIWALVNLDRLAAQSGQLVITGASVAEQNQQLVDQIGSLERVTLQYVVLQNPGTLELVQTDLARVEDTLAAISPIAEQAGALELVRSIRFGARQTVSMLEDPGRLQPDPAGADGVEDIEAAASATFARLRQSTRQLARTINTYIDGRLADILASTEAAQQVAAWMTVALVPGTVVLVLFFILLVSKPIRQIDRAIDQLGKGGFSKPIEVRGPTDLERLGRQLEWLRVRLLELAQERNRFLRHMSHELKTPLANIREGTELLLDGAVGELKPPQREVTDILRSNGLKLQHLIENLLSFSAWQSRSEVLNLSDFPLRALIIAVAKSHRLALKNAHIQLKLEVEDVDISADRDKLRTVFDNLFSNAIKFTPRGGLIVIRGQRLPEGIVLEFADTGPGIPEHEQPRVFEAFFQGRRQQGGYVGGTGIGLSVVLECIQAHDGSVELVNDGEFPGAHFRLFIPQRAAEEQRIAISA